MLLWSTEFPGLMCSVARLRTQNLKRIWNSISLYQIWNSLQATPLPPVDSLHRRSLPMDPHMHNLLAVAALTYSVTTTRSLITRRRLSPDPCRQCRHACKKIIRSRTNRWNPARRFFAVARGVAVAAESLLFPEWTTWTSRPHLPCRVNVIRRLAGGKNHRGVSQKFDSATRFRLAWKEWCVGDKAE